MSAPLKVKRSALEKHLDSTEEVLAEFISDTKLFADWNVIPVCVGLVGNECEYTARNRGGNVWVSRVHDLGGELWAWVGYREEWDGERPAGRVQRFSFRSAGLTIHIGYQGDQHKPQVFRAEWAGWAKWNGRDYGYQGGDAAHPHWQFDAVDSLTDSEEAEALLEVLKDEGRESEPRDFVPQTVEPEAERILISQKRLSRMHFPSAAMWWRDPPENAHAHSPQSPEEIQAWLSKTLKYVVRELAYLQS